MILIYKNFIYFYLEKMKFLSVDIGEKNLGWTFAETKSNDISNIEEINFTSGLFDYKDYKNKNIIFSRINSLYEFVEKFDEIDYCVIERQVPSNPVAMCLMYSLSSFIRTKTDKIEIFDPKLKFVKIGQTYSTVNKQHKKQSINNMKVILNSFESNSFENLIETLNDNKKKDDISDSFNQLLIFLIDNHFVNLTFDNLKKILNRT